MTGLVRGKINDFVEGVYDGPHATPPQSDEGPIFLGVTNVTPEGRLDFSEIRHISERDFPRWTKRVVPQPGDIVFSYEATLHRYARIPEGFRGCLGRRMALVRPKPELVDSRFLHYYFLTWTWRAQVEAYVISGATVDRIPIAKFPDFEVALPPLEQQTRIADILDLYDKLIENNRRRIQLLEESARLLYREWFVRLRFPGYEHVKVVDGVPEEWEVRPLAEVADITMGQSPKSEFYNQVGDGLPFHQGASDFGERFVNHRVYTTIKNRVANAGDILCTVRAPVGRLNMTLDQIVVGRGLSAIREKYGRQSHLYYQLKQHFFREDLFGTGAIFAGIKKKELAQQKLVRPPDKLINEFEEYAQPIDQQIATLTKQNQKLAEARDILLPRLMNGEITV